MTDDHLDTQPTPCPVCEGTQDATECNWNHGEPCEAYDD